MAVAVERAGPAEALVGGTEGARCRTVEASSLSEERSELDETPTEVAWEGRPGPVAVVPPPADEAIPEAEAAVVPPPAGWLSSSLQSPGPRWL